MGEIKGPYICGTGSCAAPAKLCKQKVYYGFGRVLLGRIKIRVSLLDHLKY